ncbi:hypothetical protein FA09DRAFT_361163 [Tilletiopsis washingtonensis]|uniref:DASH complex subunit DUO1 n=1 Tax=Tilletiopsis washingtonensis TaxID=58919 RepID=A0A316Z6V9_9BASI|nr:hypothetical protein FA09DRAFT_361163 [Tilletiopsis washingtonensis]PWN97339.1 hypothetical protein FA09DRAFT_361163 [Tilletiopsis washingtonensis]
MPPRTPPKGSSSSSSSSASRRAAAAAMESPTLDARFSLRGLAEADVGDDSGLVDFAALRVAEPSSPAAPVARTTKAPTAVPRRAPRPSWGPLGPPTAAASKAKMRLLEGIADSSALEEEASRRSAPPVAGAGARPRARYSLFQKASLYAADSSAAAADESFAPEAHDDADDSYLHAASAPPPAMSASTAEEPTPSSRAESAEARAAQLAELRRMNETFEAYERMLLESREQVETFSTRIAQTDALLDMYIDLLRQADRTQRLLLDADWHGATEDAAAHALSLELAARETAPAPAPAPAISRPSGIARARGASAGAPTRGTGTRTAASGTGTTGTGTGGVRSSGYGPR